MLILTRKKHQGIIVEVPQGIIHIVVIDIVGDNRVKIGIKAPNTMKILRQEVLKNENKNTKE